eukprot:GILK01007748.1.p1 GENE.GILK01007748.1~~GILK01007748.1.p1  ORF type:complete len:252 (+),score=26.31 GILK01007748.1:35-757(+)
MEEEVKVVSVSKAVLVVLETHGGSLPDDRPYAALDRLCQLGCTGVLTLRREHSQSVLSEVLRAAPYGKLSVSTHSHHQGDNDDETLACIQRILATHDAVILHIDAGSSHSSLDHAMQSADFVFRSFLDAKSDVWMALVVGLTPLPSASFIPSPLSGPLAHEVALLRPPQSFHFVDGQFVDLDLSLGCCTVQYHPTLCRRDRVQRLFFTDVCTQGGDGVILAEHLMRQIAFRLGRMPKYGA